jgi:hypothetical protein
LVEREAFYRHFSTSYDDQAGSLTVTIEDFDAPRWRDEQSELDFAVANSCGQFNELQGHVFSAAHENGGSASLNGFGGEVLAPAAFNGQQFSFTFQDAHFVGRDWHCVRIDGETFALDGWPTLNPHTDAEVFLAKVGHGVPAVEKATVCPGIEISNAHSFCIAEYPAGGHWHLVEGIVTVSGHQYVATVGFHRAWIRQWRRSGPSCLAEYNVTGHLESNDGACDGHMASEVEYELRHYHRVPKRTAWAGTNTAGFNPVVLWHCQGTRFGRVVCSNAVGDAFRYSL